MWEPLKDGVVALRVTSAPTTTPGRPFGRCGMWFDREPTELVVEEIGLDMARTLCEEAQLTVVQLTAADLAPDSSDSVPSPEPAASSFPPPVPLPSKGTRKKPAKKKRSKRGG